MAAFQKFQDYSEQLHRGVHNWGAHTFNIALSSIAPVVTNAVLADLTQIAAGNGYVAGGVAVTGLTIAETGGTTTIQANQVVITAAGGAIASFRYYSLYNATAAAKNLVGFWDHGAAVALADGDSFTIKFNNASPGTILTAS